MTIEIVDLSHHWLFDATLSIIVTIIDNEVIFGACLGAWVVVGSRRDLRAWQQIGSFLLSACVGYLFTPVVLPHLTGFSAGATAFFCALVVIPISIKIMKWVNATDIADILRRFKGPK